MAQIQSKYVSVKYHFFEKKIDVIFKNSEKQIILKVCLEHGSPIGVDKDEYYYDLD